MIMITIVICLVLEMFTSQLPRFRSYDWFGAYAVKVRGLFGDSAYWDGPWGVLAVLAGPVLLVALFQAGLDEVWLGLFELILGVLVLLYSLRYQPMDQLVDQFSDAMDSSETERAVHIYSEIAGEKKEVHENLVQECSETILVQANERIFAVVLWFALLGPLGALLYRLSWWLSEISEAEALQSESFKIYARSLYGILSWVPARLLAAGYAITGSFEEALHGWRQVVNETGDDIQSLSERVLVRSGGGAMHIDKYNLEEEEQKQQMDVAAVKATRGLVLRTLLAWGIVIAIITLAGWVS